MAETVRYSKRLGQYTAIGTVAATLDNLRQSVQTCLDAGADRFYLYDTRGWHTPQAMAYLTRFVRDIVGDRMEIAVHCHDDFGLAVANTVEAVRAGADVVDVTLIRTGHRCGNASFEQTVIALEVLHDIRTGIELEKLHSLCHFVAETYGLRIPPNAPIVGDHMFVYGGVHINALLTGAWFLWENLRAEVVGHRRRIVFGPTALRRGAESPIALKARQMGVQLSEAQLEQVYQRLGAIIEERHQADEVEVESLIREAAR
jgi:2-isopropylmalate synthase